MRRFIATLLLLGCFASLAASAQSGQTLPVIINIPGIDGFLSTISAGYDSQIISLDPINNIDEEGGDIEIVLHSQPPANINQIVAQSLLASRCTWLTYQGVGTKRVSFNGSTAGKPALKFRISPNTTPHSRIVMLGCPSPARNAHPGVAILQSGSNSTLARFDLSSATKYASYPGYRYTIKLSGSEQGVEYTLLRFNEDVARLTGTGRQLEFTGDWGVGVFTVVANRGTGTRVMRNSLEIPWSLLVQDGVGRIGSSDGSSVVLPAEGGQGEIMVMFEHVFEQSQVAMEGSYMLDSWIAGDNEKWNSDFRLVKTRGGSNYAYLTVSAGPNTTDSVKSGILSVGFDSDGYTRNMYVVQEPMDVTRPLIKYSLSIVNYTEQAATGCPTDLHLSGSQKGVLYKLYSNGVEVRSMEGSGAPLAFWDVTQNGPFTAKAFRGDEELSMHAPWRSTTRKNPSRVEETIYNLGLNGSIWNCTTFDGLGRTIREMSEPYGGFASIEEMLGYDYNDFIDLTGDFNYDPGFWWAVAMPITHYYNGQITEYDAVGRPFRKRIDDSHLFYREGNPHDYYYYDDYSIPGYVGEPLGYDRREYAEVQYDNTPQNRIIRETPEGFLHESYTDGKADYLYDYGKNTSSDAVKRFVLHGDGLVLSGTYPAGALLKTAVSGPHEQAGAEFRSHEGLLVASREAADHFTHYVYDDLGRLRYVIPPLMDSLFTDGVRSFEDLRSLCYWYEYDEEGRVYHKNIPGAGITTYLYNKRGQPVLYEDSPGRWIFTKYDIHGRVVQTGTCRGTEQEHRQKLAAQQVFHETARYVPSNSWDYPVVVSMHGYSNSAYPTDFEEGDLLTVYFYDNYDWQHYGCHPFQSGQALGKGHVWSTRGMQTGLKERVLGADVGDREWLATTYYYDPEGRIRQKISDMSIPGQQVESFLYNENGDVVQSRVRQQQTVPNPFTVLSYDRFYKYNPAGKLHRIEQEIAGDDQNGKVTLATYWYDYRGDLSHKWLHGLWDTVRYSRAIDRTLIGVRSSSLDYELKRDDAAAPYARYDGNIGEIYREMGAYSRELGKTDFYTYDQLGRIKTFNTSWYEEAKYSYDRNGNLTYVFHQKDRYLTEDIHLEYGVSGNGNALKAITKNGTRYDGYTYSLRGHMRHDAARDIDISYNVLNLPSKIGNVSYTYTSTGRKLMTSVDGSKTHYQGEAVYVDYRPQSLSNPEGESRFTSSHPLAIGFDTEYRYFYRDHLGSVRAISTPTQYWWQAGDMYATDRWGGDRYYWNIDYQQVDYFPFGQMIWENDLAQNKVLFTGKEFQDGPVGDDVLRLYDFGARFYDPTVGRWTTIDPLAELYYSQSPYNFCGNNPIMFVDRNGMNYTYAGGIYYKTNSDGTRIPVEWEEVLEWIQNPENSDTYTVSDSSPQGGSILNSGVTIPFPVFVAGGAALKGLLAKIGVVATRASIIALPLTFSGDTRKKEPYTYINYVMKYANGKVYVGRTSGPGSIEDIMHKRLFGHHLFRRLFGEDKEVLPESIYIESRTVPDHDRSYRDASRGREQQWINYYGGPGIGGQTYNLRNEISPTNPKYFYFINRAVTVYGELRW